MLKKLRVALAIIFWLCITILFLDLTGVTRAWFGWMARVQFLPAVLAANVAVVVLWVVVTMLIGRIYCSVICPLGIMQDGMIHVADWVHRLRTKKKIGRYHFWAPRWTHWMRLVVLAVVIVCIVVGGGFVVQLLAPYSSYGRIATGLFRPVVLWVNDMLANAAAERESYAFWHVTWSATDLSLVVTAAVSLVVLAITSTVGGRFYCNNLCPVGTALGLLSRRALVRIHIDGDKCVKCGLCERKCKSSAIDSKNGHIDNTRCVDCFNCLGACHKDAISFGLAKASAAKNDNVETAAPSAKNENIDTSRRAFLATAVTLAAASQLKAVDKVTDGGLAVIEDKKRYERQTPICPPGALSLKNLQQHCTGCQLCVSACPNGVLHPSSSLQNFLQPTVSYEVNHCRPECHACSDVCPAGAILPLGKTHEEKMQRKSSLKVGRAVWIQDNCLPVANGVKCGNCAVHCPTGAITMVPTVADDPRSPKVPSVDDERCIGCGACEHLCPVRPFSAIHVEGIEVQREI